MKCSMKGKKNGGKKKKVSKTKQRKTVRKGRY
jgi:hypothetical protein